MIEKIRSTGGYPSKLPALADRVFEFSPGINIVFGENASGKSTLLALLALHSGCTPNGGGWSRFIEPCLDIDKIPYPKRFAERGNLRNRALTAEVVWDGSATFYHNTSIADAPITDFDTKDGLSETDQFARNVRRVVHKQSSGQLRMQFLYGVFDQMKKPPDLTKVPAQKENDVWHNARKDFAAYVKTLPRKGPPTLLFDEPDRSMSLPNQKLLWDDLLRAKLPFQVIVATHSPFALAYQADHLNFIEMTPGYIEACRKALKALC